LTESMSYRDHLTSSDSLVTPYEETRAGFIALAHGSVTIFSKRDSKQKG